MKTFHIEEENITNLRRGYPLKKKRYQLKTSKDEHV